MPEGDTSVSDYADELMSVPRAHVVLDLSQEDSGLKLMHQGKIVVECYLTREGMAAAGYMAKALGVDVPALGKSVQARVSTGVLFRAVSIASLDFNNKQSFFLLDRWLEEAEMQRRGSSDAT